jgi:hypothetical protein
MQKNDKKHDNSSNCRVCKYTLIACMFMAAGCTQQPLTRQAPTRIKLTDSYLHAEQNHDFHKAELMKAAEDVLTGMHFTIEKADVENGIIRTRPLPGAQFFELWRSDNVGADNAFAANLHTIRRTVTLNITQQNLPGDDRRHNELQIGCDVHVQRLSLPTRQVSSSARVYGMFSRSSPSLQKLQLTPQQKKQMEWIDLGRDSQLEAEILKRIETQILRHTSHVPGVIYGNLRLQTMESKT